MLRAESISNYSNVYFQLDKDQTYLLNIVQIDNWGYESLIGRFNFYTKEGFLLIPNKKQRKEFKQWKSLFNTFFTYDNQFGWDSTNVEAAMNAGKEQIKADKQASTKQYKELWTNKAIEFLNKLNTRDETTINGLQSFKDKSDNDLITIINNTFKNEINKQLTNNIFQAIKKTYAV
jgi:hypothetical protein